MNLKQNADIKAFFDPGTWTFTYVVYAGESSPCVVIDSKVARCLYKFSSAPVSATITVINDKGEQSVATTSVTESGGWLKLTARNFEFSSPSISIKLQQEIAVVPQMPVQPSTNTSDASKVSPEKTAITSNPTTTSTRGNTIVNP